MSKDILSVYPVITQLYTKMIEKSYVIKCIPTKNMKLQMYSSIKNAPNAFGLCRFGVLDICHVHSTKGN